jgi:hypothetical protein
MARPARYAARETGKDPADLEERDAHRTILTSKRTPGERVIAPAADAPAVQGAANEPIDESRSERQSLRHGQVSEGELELSRAVASRTGWVPLEQWKRDPAKWVDADIYLERMPAEVERLKDRVKRTGAVADAAQDARRQQERIRAEADVRAAVKAGDEDGAVAASTRVAAASGPDPRTLAWVAANPWFEKDPVAKAAAMAEAQRRAAAGESVEDQLEGSEALIRRAFPEHFPDQRRAPSDEFEEDDRREPLQQPQRPSGGEARLSDLRGAQRQAPEVQGGSRGGGGQRARSREMGWGDIPAGERDQMDRFVKRFERRGMKTQDAQYQLGVEYWRNKGTQV